MCIRDRVQIARQLARPLPQRPFTATLLGNLFHDWVESLYSQERVGGTLFEEDALDSDEDTNSSLRLASDAERESLVALQSTFLASRFAMAGNAPIAVELPISMLMGSSTAIGAFPAIAKRLARNVDCRATRLSRSASLASRSELFVSSSESSASSSKSVPPTRSWLYSDSTQS